MSCVLAVTITMSSPVGASWSIDVTASMSTTSLPFAVRSVRPLLVDGRCVRWSGDQRDVCATLAQATTDHAADRTGAEDDHSHVRHRTGAGRSVWRAQRGVGRTARLTGGAKSVALNTVVRTC